METKTKKQRLEEIKEKGFSFDQDNDENPIVKTYGSVDFSKIKVGAKVIEDAVYNISSYQKVNSDLFSKEKILSAINSKDIEAMRKISNHFYDISGIYSRLCRYMAYLYKYDWIITPYVEDEQEKTNKKALENFYKVLLYLDDIGIKKLFGDIALKVVKNGCYYGYMIKDNTSFNLQELSPLYCRSRFEIKGRPVIEFNMKYFDSEFKDTNQRIRMLNLFPNEFKKGYIAYKEGKLPAQFSGDSDGWYLLDVNNTVKFNLNGQDQPAFISVIPSILDLDAAKELDRKKQAQELLKIIIQKMPLDKNGELLFDVDEAKELHNNAVGMLRRAVGVDVLTTFADVEVANMASNRAATAMDDLERVERSIYNEAGVSQMQFNTDGNIALEKSILNDEAAMFNLISQFENFLNYIISDFNKSPKKFFYKAQILTTTIYNYKEISKLFKEQTQLGYSKMLPQIALGQSQSSILAAAYFENDVLELYNVFIPPMMSSTMNGDALEKMKTNKKSETGGRPTKEESGEAVSEKTIQNQEAKS